MRICQKTIHPCINVNFVGRNTNCKIKSYSCNSSFYLRVYNSIVTYPTSLRHRIIDATLNKFICLIKEGEEMFLFMFYQQLLFPVLFSTLILLVMVGRLGNWMSLEFICPMFIIVFSLCTEAGCWENVLLIK